MAATSEGSERRSVKTLGPKADTPTSAAKASPSVEGNSFPKYACNPQQAGRAKTYESKTEPKKKELNKP
jgi:hypothetical protein